MTEHVVRYRDTSADGNSQGPDLKLDLSTGRVYDQNDNLVEKWTPADDDKTALLADYVREEMSVQAAYSMSRTDPGRARLMLADAGVDPERLVKMDLGPADVHIPAALPNFASGYRNEPPIADMVAPPLLVNKQVDDYWQFDKNDAFQRAEPQGAARGEVGEIAPRLANAQYSCKERALGGWVSTSVEANADTPLKIMQATARRVMNALTIDREIRVTNLVTTSGNWDTSVVTALGGTANWNGGSTSDPLKDLHTAMDASWGAVTGIVMARPTWHAMLRNSNVQKYFAFKDGAAPQPSPEEMGRILDLPPIYIGRMQYINTSLAKAYVWGTSVVLIRQPEQLPPQTQDDVATCYTFRWNVQQPKDGVASGGFIVRRFFTQNRGTLGGEKLVIVSFDAEQMTSKFVGGLITGAYV